MITRQQKYFGRFKEALAERRKQGDESGRSIDTVANTGQYL